MILSLKMLMGSQAACTGVQIQHKGDCLIVLSDASSMGDLINVIVVS